MNNIYNSLYEKDFNSHDMQKNSIFMKNERVFIYWISRTHEIHFHCLNVFLYYILVFLF